MQEMSPKEIERLLGAAKFGILSLAAEGDAYAIPLLFGRGEDDAFYFHSRPGMKDDFMRATHVACLLVLEVEDVDSWRSVQVFGRLERLVGAKARAAAEGVLAHVPFPPEWSIVPGAPATRGARGSLIWRFVPSRMQGRKSGASARP